MTTAPQLFRTIGLPIRFAVLTLIGRRRRSPKVWFAVAAFVATAFTTSVSAEEGLRVDCGAIVGEIRPLHGINCGPICEQGLVDLSDRYRELGVPLVRLHDCHWPNPDVVDLHVVFPDFDADPEAPENYRFERTDAYVAATLATGAGIVFRLGESIEHSPHKEHVHPPADVEKWAASCLGVIRHFNDGWADGHRCGIRYWEIWNEPENRPAMWTGTDEDYFRLYAAASTAIKKRYPDLKVGGPAVGATGPIENGVYLPTAFVTGFLDRCREEKSPLDFFSWHCYSHDPRELVDRAKGVRAVLDERGFAQTESHLNEWNYLPDSDWGPLVPSGQGEARKRWYERTTGPEGAAFAATALALLQDAPLDESNFYRGEIGGFSAFDHFGGPTKSFYGLKAFSLLAKTPRRCEVSGQIRDIVACAGADGAGTKVTLMTTLFATEQRELDVEFENLPWQGPTRWMVQVVDATRNLETVASQVVDYQTVRVATPVKGPCVALVQLEPATP